MAENKQGQLMVSDGKSVKVFDNLGTFLYPLDLLTENELDPAEYYIQDVATDEDDNIYVAIQPHDRKKKAMVKVYNGQAEKQHEFYLTAAEVKIQSIVVDDDKNILVSLLSSSMETATARGLIKVDYTVQVYENRGKLLDSIKISCRTSPRYCHTAAGFGRVFVYDSFQTVLYIYGAQEKGSLALEKKLVLNEPPPDRDSAIICGSGSLFIALFDASFDLAYLKYQVSMYSEDGEYIRRCPIDFNPEHGVWKFKKLLAINDGGVAVALEYRPEEEKDEDLKKSKDKDADEESIIKVIPVF